jgi:metacaspase-1
MTKRALLIGVNRYPSAPLRGCINDVHDVAKMLMSHGYKEKDICVITDGDATRERCLYALKSLRDVHRAGDEFFGQNSTHGDQIADRNGDEADGLDEVVCMVNYNWDAKTSLVDDDMHEVFSTLDPGGKAFWVADSCHSGTLDRELSRWRHRAHPAAPHSHPASRRPQKLHKRVKDISRLPVAMISGCSATQTSADAEFGGRPNGAMTYFLLQQLSQTPHASVRQTIQGVQRKLVAAGYSQRPELIGPLPLIDRPFFDL